MLKILNTETTGGRTTCVVLQVDGREALHHQDWNIRVFNPEPPAGQPGSSAPTGAPRSTGALSDDLEAFFWQQPGPGPDFLKALDFDFSSLFRVVEDVGPGAYGNPLHFAKKNNLWLEAVKNLKDGRVLFVTKSWRHSANVCDAPAVNHLVVKQQFLSQAVCDYVVTPNQSSAELVALFQLNFLMVHKHIAPLFCELKSHMAFYDIESNRHLLSTTMPRYAVDVFAWMDEVCPLKPSFTVSADPLASWVFSQGAGRILAKSKHRADHVLFNNTIRGVLLQFCLALAQAQRYMCFTHNDLHAGNVMFDTRNIGHTRMFVTALGSFFLPQATPGIRLIDFQHAAFDTYDAQWTKKGRMHGVKASVHNGFSMHYDVWRFCTNLVLSCLRDVWQVIDRDLQQFLWDQCQFEGVPGSSPPALTAQQHWCPFLLVGTSPEDLLLSEVFDSYRCDPLTTAAHVVTFETANNVTLFNDESFVRRRALCTRDELLGTRRANVIGLFKSPTTVCHSAGFFEELLQPVVKNYALNAIGFVVLKHEHTHAQKAAFLYMELLTLQRACKYFWDALATPALQASLLAFASVQARHADACALLDAVIVVLKADFSWIGRPTNTPEHVDYNERVRQHLLLPLVRAVGSVPLCALPAHTLGDEWLAPLRESDNQRFKPLFLNSIHHSQYCEI